MILRSKKVPHFSALQTVAGLDISMFDRLLSMGMEADKFMAEPRALRSYTPPTPENRWLQV